MSLNLFISVSVGQSASENNSMKNNTGQKVNDASIMFHDMHTITFNGHNICVGMVNTAMYFDLSDIFKALGSNDAINHYSLLINNVKNMRNCSADIIKARNKKVTKHNLSAEALWIFLNNTAQYRKLNNMKKEFIPEFIKLYPVPGSIADVSHVIDNFQSVSTIKVCRGLSLTVGLYHHEKYYMCTEIFKHLVVEVNEKNYQDLIISSLAVTNIRFVTCNDTYYVLQAAFSA